MTKKLFTEEQIKEIQGNPNVVRCSDKSITYAKEFKIKAIQQYKLGMVAREIFQDAGFDLQLIGKNKMNDCLSRWRKTYKSHGHAGLNKETRGRGKGGGRPKTKGLTDADRIKRLEIENAYLKAENDFLAKLRANKKR